jgi:hypothetical protein
MTENLKQETGCGCSGTKSATEAAGATQEKFVAFKTPKKEIDIEFLYLDLEVCEMCKGTESNLDEALREVSAVLEKTGVRVNLNKIHVESFEQALSLGFLSSPTIRVNGRDISLDVKENYCSKCSQLSGEETYCRVWNFQGEEFSSVPKSLVIETVLKEIYGAEKSIESNEASGEQAARSLNNLKRFFEGRTAKGNIAGPAIATKETSATGCGCS